MENYFPLVRCAVLVGEVWSMDYADFLDFSLGGDLGGRRDEVGVWLAMGSKNFGVSAEPKPWHPQVKQHGWHRWALPGADGVTRSRLDDSSAPWVECSPDGTTIWHAGGRSKIARRLNLAHLLRAASAHAQRVHAYPKQGGALLVAGVSA